MDATLDLNAILATAMQAFHSHAWAVLAGVVLTLVVGLLKKFDVVDKLPPQYVSWGAVGLAMLTSVALGLTQSKPAMDIIMTGLSIGLASIGVYETAGK